MGANFSLPNDIQNGTTGDADEVMSNFNTILSNFTPVGMDDASANVAAMQTTVDPYPGDSESLATALSGELHRLRFLFKQITGETQWYIDPDGSLAGVYTNSATFSGKKTFSNNVIFTKGADVASATALPVITDGNYFDVTGTTAITSIDTVGVGVWIKLHFDGALILTHNATDLILPGAANITTVAGDEAEFVEYATGDWRCVNYQRTSGVPVVAGRLVQQVNTQTGTSSTGTTVIPLDNTIPQNTEGDEVMTLAITPTNASNKLKIEVVVVGTNGSGGNLIAALFQDSTANSLAAASQSWNAGTTIETTAFTHYMTAGTTSATTFKIRYGSNVAGTTYFNIDSGTADLGGVFASSITISEVTV